MGQEDVLMEIKLPLPKVGEKAGEIKKTKIREVFEAGVDDQGRDLILMVATDRISVRDVVLLSGIPGKGRVLTEISSYWFRETADICCNAFITNQFEEFPSDLKERLASCRSDIEGRSTLMYKASPFLVECIVRDVLVGKGSAWISYEKNGKVCGIQLPKGMKKDQKFAAPLFTPSTKAPVGEHDKNISFEEMRRIVEIAHRGQELRAFSLSLYCYAQNVAALMGFGIDDTKFEFGILKDEETGREHIVVIDELLTPDSSRYNPDYSKQPLRNWLEQIGWDGTPIELPSDRIEKTSQDYNKALAMILH
ncbi:MAG: phosphoribosylaminoimidazolesuccinocarboxamide synthase [Candidatus Nealsonbacteria bacterium]|nr:phosphoribosylaminoimidazolesuccinocarboxamide synthase [Candidatus Nealsonbacteria bacterium]